MSAPEQGKASEGVGTPLSPTKGGKGRGKSKGETYQISGGISAPKQFASRSPGTPPGSGRGTPPSFQNQTAPSTPPNPNAPTFIPRARSAPPSVEQNAQGSPNHPFIPDHHNQVAPRNFYYPSQPYIPSQYYQPPPTFSSTYKPPQETPGPPPPPKRERRPLAIVNPNDVQPTSTTSPTENSTPSGAQDPPAVPLTQDSHVPPPETKEPVPSTVPAEPPVEVKAMDSSPISELPEAHSSSSTSAELKPPEQVAEPQQIPEQSQVQTLQDSQSESSKKQESDEEDDWETKNENDLKVAAVPEVSLRPTGPVAPFGSTLDYSETQWSPHNPTGKKIYGREFLLAFKDAFTAPPQGIPILEDIKGGPSRGGGGGEKGTDWKKFGDQNATRAPPVPRTGSISSRGGESRGRDNRTDRDRGGKGRGASGSSKKAKAPPAPKVDLPNRQDEGKAWKRPKDVDPEKALLLKANGLLNKLTIDTFEVISTKLSALQFNTQDLLKGVISLIFEKALSQPKFSFMYARLCARVSAKSITFEAEGQSITFKRLLLNQCQSEFEKGKHMYTDEGREALATADKESGKSPEELVEMETARRKRMLGNIKYIGELFNAKMLTEKIMHECIQRLIGDINKPIPEHMEALNKLLSTIGPHIDHPRAKAYMDEYFKRIKLLSQDKRNQRIHFMLLNLIELRESNWVARSGQKESGPMSIQQVHQEAAKKEREEQMMNDAQLARAKRGGQVPPAPSKKDQGDWEMAGRTQKKPQPERASVPAKGSGKPSDKKVDRGRADLSNAFAALDGSDESPKKPNANRGGPPAPLKEMDQEKLDQQLDLIFQDLFESQDVNEALNSLKDLRTPPSQNKAIVDSLLLHVYEVQQQRAKDAACQLLVKLPNAGFSSGDLTLAFEDAMEQLQDISLDLPSAPTDFGMLLGHILGTEHVKIDILQKMPEDFIASKFRVKDERDCGKAAEVVCSMLQTLALHPKGTTIWGKTSLLNFLCPDRRSTASVEHLVKTKKLFGFFPEITKPLAKSDEFLALLKSKQENLSQWVTDNLKPEDASQALAAVLQFVLKDATSADLKDTFSLIRPCLKTHLKGMVVLLQQVQEFCEKEGERDSLKDIFEVLYANELMPIDAFKAWAKANPEASARLGSWLEEKLEEERERLAALNEDSEEE